MKSSVQLWSFQKGRTKEDFEEILSLASQAGYDGVELLEHDVSADEMKKLLEKYNLYAKSAHISIKTFENKLEEMLEYHHKIGCEYVIIPIHLYDNPDDIEKVVNILNNASKAAEKYGIKVGYHNHNHEFKKIGDKYIIDHLFEKTNENVIFELDVFWVYNGGEDPIEFIKKFGSRAELIHLKQSDENKKNVDLPDGIINMKEIINTAKYAKHFIVEQEEFEESSFKSCKKAADYLKKI